MGFQGGQASAESSERGALEEGDRTEAGGAGVHCPGRAAEGLGQSAARPVPPVRGLESSPGFPASVSPNAWCNPFLSIRLMSALPMRSEAAFFLDTLTCLSPHLHGVLGPDMSGGGAQDGFGNLPRGTHGCQARPVRS